MRTQDEIRREIKRLNGFIDDGKRHTNAQLGAWSNRVESLRWALGETSVFDEEEREVAPPEEGDTVKGQRPKLRGTGTVGFVGTVVKVVDEFVGEKLQDPYILVKYAEGTEPIMMRASEVVRHES